MSESINGTPGDKGFLVSDLILMALRQIGIGAMGASAGSNDIADGVMHLNMLLAQWQRKRWLVPNLVDMAFMSTGKSMYQIGPGGDLDVPVRPSQIMAAYARLLNGAPQSSQGDFKKTDFTPQFLVTQDGLNGEGQETSGQFSSDDFSDQFSIDGGATYTGSQPIDYALEPIASYEDYAGLGLKGLRAWPSFYHYNPAFSLGEFRPWPIPVAGIWELHILYAEQLPSSLVHDSAINLPPEYWDALMWSLAARLAPSYGQSPDPTVLGAMKSALGTIRSANTQVPTLGMPSILSPNNAPFYWPGMQVQRL